MKTLPQPTTRKSVKIVTVQAANKQQVLAFFKLAKAAKLRTFHEDKRLTMFGLLYKYASEHNDYPEMVKGAATCIVAMKGSRMVGIGFRYAIDDADTFIKSRVSVFVKETERNQGIATRIIKELLEVHPVIDSFEHGIVSQEFYAKVATRLGKEERVNYVPIPQK